jgi:hypothetical protein
MEFNKITVRTYKNESRILSEQEYDDMLRLLAKQIANLLAVGKPVTLSEVKSERITTFDRTEFVFWVNVQFVKKPLTFWQRVVFLATGK